MCEGRSGELRGPPAEDKQGQADCPMSRPAAPTNAQTFEEQTAAFASDDRIHYSKVTGTWQYEDDDGTEMEWDAARGVWKPLVC